MHGLNARYVHDICLENQNQPVQNTHRDRKGIHVMAIARERRPFRGTFLYSPYTLPSSPCGSRYTTDTDPYTPPSPVDLDTLQIRTAYDTPIPYVDLDTLQTRTHIHPLPCGSRYTTDTDPYTPPPLWISIHYRHGQLLRRSCRIPLLLEYVPPLHQENWTSQKCIDKIDFNIFEVKMPYMVASSIH